MKRKFYSLRFNNKSIGTYPQIKDYEWEEKNNFDSTFKKMPIEGKISEETFFPKFYLNNKAHKTDILSLVYSTGKYLLISPEMKELIESCNAADKQLFEVEVSVQSIDYSYYIYYQYNYQDNFAKFVDWEKSSFILKRSFSSDKVVTNFIDYESFENCYRESAYMIFNNLVVNELWNLDLFRLRLPLFGYYCSENFKRKAEEQNITGLLFEQI